MYIIRCKPVSVSLEMCSYPYLRLHSHLWRQIWPIKFIKCSLKSTDLQRGKSSSKELNVYKCVSDEILLDKTMWWTNTLHPRWCSKNSWLFPTTETGIGFRSGLLIFCDVAISHNWPQIATFCIIRRNRIIQAKLLNLRKEQGNIRPLIKLYDNLSVVSRWFTSQKTLDITIFVR